MPQDEDAEIAIDDSTETSVDYVTGWFSNNSFMTINLKLLFPVYFRWLAF